MDGGFNPWKFILIRHAQMRMIGPIHPVKRFEPPVAGGRSRKCPYKILLECVWSDNLAVSESKRLCVFLGKIVPGSEACFDIFLLVGDQPFFHIFLVVDQLTIPLINSCSGLSLIAVLL